MKNLIITASNYSNIGGKTYGIDEMGCNYPVRLDIFNSNVTFAQGSTFISTDGNFYDLLGGSIQNNNVPLYKWICDTGSNGVVFEISHILSSTTAVITSPAPLAGATYEFGVIDYFGQPALEQTLITENVSVGTFYTGTIYTKYGTTSMSWAGTPVPIGNEPILVNFAGNFSTGGLLNQFTS